MFTRFALALCVLMALGFRASATITYVSSERYVQRTLEGGARADANAFNDFDVRLVSPPTMAAPNGGEAVAAQRSRLLSDRIEVFSETLALRSGDPNVVQALSIARVTFVLDMPTFVSIYTGALAFSGGAGIAGAGVSTTQDVPIFGAAGSFGSRGMLLQPGSYRFFANAESRNLGGIPSTAVITATLVVPGPSVCAIATVCLLTVQRRRRELS